MLDKDKLRQMKAEELNKELFNLNKELFELNIKASTGEVVKSRQKKLIKKDIARIKTIMSEVIN
jgi:large subunit ribosomal protein L29